MNFLLKLELKKDNYEKGNFKYTRDLKLPTMTFEVIVNFMLAFKENQNPFIDESSSVVFKWDVEEPTFFQKLSIFLFI